MADMGRTEAERADMVKRSLEQLERLDDLNESRQSDWSGAAHFFGTALKEAMDRFHTDWSIVRDDFERLRAERDLLAKECAQWRLGFAGGFQGVTDMRLLWAAREAVDAAGCLKGEK